MKVIKASEGTIYEAANHFGFWGIKKITNPELSQNLSVSISEFLPGGGASLTSSTKERVYVALRGNMIIRDENDHQFELHEGDMIYIPPHEKRAMEITGTEACRVLVIIGDITLA